MNSADPALEAPRYRYTVPAMLVLVYTFNFIDRQIVGILAVPITADHGLTDTQLGLMGGLSFALLYTFSRYADRIAPPLTPAATSRSSSYLPSSPDLEAIFHPRNDR